MKTQFCAHDNCANMASKYPAWFPFCGNCVKRARFTIANTAQYKDYMAGWRRRLADAVDASGGREYGHKETALNEVTGADIDISVKGRT